MDNVLKRTIRNEIENFYVDHNNESNERSSNQGLKRKKSESRLGSLLNRIRDKTNTKPEKTKSKRICIKYERFNTETKGYKFVRQNHGGGMRFIEVNPGNKVTFGELKKKAIDLYFDFLGKCNYFEENIDDCQLSIIFNGKRLDEDEDLWEYLKNHGFMPSKVIFFLRSVYDNSNDTKDTESVHESDFNMFQFYDDNATTDDLLDINPFNDQMFSQSSTLTAAVIDASVITPSSQSSTITATVIDASTTTPSLPINENQNSNETAFKSIKLHRINIMADMVKAFKTVDVSDTIYFKFIDTRGNEEKGVGIGVTRDAYTSFWKEAADSLFVGEKFRVPFVRHDYFIDEWVAIAKIIVKGYEDCNYFPTVLSPVFVIYCLFNETSDLLLKSFTDYLSKDDQETFSKLISNEFDDDFLKSDDCLDFLDQFKCRTMVTKENILLVVTELANQELIQKPHVMIASWKPILQTLQKHYRFESVEAVLQMYADMEPTSKKLIGALQAVPISDSQRDAFGHLKRFIKGLDESMLKKFTQFLTGSDVMSFDAIDVVFSAEQSDFLRRPIARTCGPTLELPTTYNNFCELRSELVQILNDNFWEMDIV